jgi:dihydrofolate reductase
MADGFISHWKAVADRPNDPDHWAGRKFTDTPKLVFTRTLDTSEWPNTELAKGDLTDEVNRLKSREGGDMIVYGGASFVSSLINEGLIDEYYLFMNPVALGSGLTIFDGLEKPRELLLTSSAKYDCGIVLQRYEPKLTGQSHNA